MTEESFSPYITIRDHQHLASSISFNEAMDPTVVWNPDMSLLDCLGFTLSIAGFRGGIQEMLASLRRRIEALCGSIPTNVSKDLTEDFSDRSIGLSWMHPTNFTGGAPLPLLKHLLEIAENCPAEVDSFGILHWNPANVAYYRRLFDQINLELSILCFILPAPSPRGTEFMDTRIRNDQISRNVYKSFGTWFIYRVVKMTNIMGSLAWIPTLLPSVLSELLDRYLLLIRPVEIIFTEILSGPASRALYEQFLWVQDGKRIDSPRFSQQLADMTEQYMGCRASIRILRHMTISIMREFTYTPTETNYIGDLVSNHSSHQAQKTYAREKGQLPFLTTDLLLKSRKFCQTWHDTLGVGENSPPIPFRLLASRLTTLYNNVSPTSTSLIPAITLDQISASVREITRATFKEENEAFKLQVSKVVEKSVAIGVSSFIAQSGITTLCQQMQAFLAAHSTTATSAVSFSPLLINNAPPLPIPTVPARVDPSPSLIKPSSVHKPQVPSPLSKSSLPIIQPAPQASSSTSHTPLPPPKANSFAAKPPPQGPSSAIPLPLPPAKPTQLPPPSKHQSPIVQPSPQSHSRPSHSRVQPQNTIIDLTSSTESTLPAEILAAKFSQAHNSQLEMDFYDQSGRFYLSIKCISTYVFTEYPAGLPIYVDEDMDFDAEVHAETEAEAKVDAYAEAEAESETRAQEVPPPQFSRSTAQRDADHALACLQDYFDDSDAKFTCKAQKDLLVFSLGACYHLLAILPTGAGKSLAWLVPAKCLRGDKSIVCSPFNAILDDQLRRARASNIRAVYWKPGMPIDDDVALLLLSWEAVTEPAVLRYDQFNISRYISFSNLQYTDGSRSMRMTSVALSLMNSIS